MAEPSLHEDIAALGREIRDLTQRFSAKEELAKKASDLAEETQRLAGETKKITDRDRRFITIVAIALAITVALAGVAAFFGYQVATCQSRFNKATELRSALLTEYTVTRDAALTALIKARGLPNDAAIIEARDRWLRDNALLTKARELNPVPKYEEYCGNIPGVSDPKVPPAKVPPPTTAAS